MITPDSHKDHFLFPNDVENQLTLFGIRRSAFISAERLSRLRRRGLSTLLEAVGLQDGLGRTLHKKPLDDI